MSPRGRCGAAVRARSGRGRRCWRTSEAITPATRLGLAAVQSAAELAWYYAQIARLGDGLDPTPELGAWRALGWFIAKDLWIGIRRRLRRMQPGRRASAELLAAPRRLMPCSARRWLAL